MASSNHFGMEIKKVLSKMAKAAGIEADIISKGDLAFAKVSRSDRDAMERIILISGFRIPSTLGDDQSIEFSVSMKWKAAS